MIKDWALKISASLILIFAPVHGMMLTALALVVVDMITGIAAARKRGEKINSHGLKRSVIKLIIYQVAIMVSHLTEVYMLKGAIPLTVFVSGLVGTTELLSVLENLNSISGSDLLRAAIDKIQIEKKNKE